MKQIRRKFGPPPWVTLIRWFSLVLAVGLIFVAPWPKKHFLPPDLFFRLDPLLGTAVILGQWILPHLLWLSLITIFITISLGRVFCGYVCPLGVWLDISGTRRGSRSRRSIKLNWRYIFLLSLLFAALLGFPLLFLFDPQGIFYRSLTLAVVPLGGKTLAVGAYQFSNWGVFSDKTDGSWDWLRSLAQNPGGIRFYLLGGFAAAMFLAITLLERLAPRFWCRFLCPLGALLSLFSRLSLLRRHVETTACNECQACSQVCPMGAIGDNGVATDFSLCFNCKECKRRCTNHAIQFNWGWSQVSSASPLNLSRRVVLGSLGVAAVMAASTRLNLYAFSKQNIIRPPGALPESKFLGRCVGCMRCAEICPTNVIAPTDLRLGMSSIYTARLDFTRQGCAQDCAACGFACPTGALLKLDLEVKSYLKLGSSFVNWGKCLAWSQGQTCLVCKESCPYGAIVAKLERTPFGDNLVPAPDRSRCIGCGTCEANCPVRGKPAIAVISDGEDRAMEIFPPSEKTILLRQRRRAQSVEDDLPPGIGGA